MFKFLVLMLFSVTVMANNQMILEGIEKRISEGNKTSFIFLNLDGVLLNNSSRYRYLFDNYLKKHRSKVIRDYLKEKDLNNLKFDSLISDISELKISDRQKEGLIKYLKENYNSPEALKEDTAAENSVEFVNKLYKNGAFIIYITERNNSEIASVVEILKKLNFPVGKNKTALIMDVNGGNIRKIISEWINMGNVAAVFASDIKFIRVLTPYLSKDKLFLISDDTTDSKKFTAVKSL